MLVGLSCVPPETPALLCVLLSLLRFLGPECMVLIANTTTSRWFNRHRGKATSILGIGLSIQPLVPTVLQQLIDHVGWRSAFRVEAIVFTCLLFVALTFLRHSPEEHRLSMDGAYAELQERPHRAAGARLEAPSPGTGRQRSEPRSAAMSSDGADIRAVLRKRLFWLLILQQGTFAPVGVRFQTRF